MIAHQSSELTSPRGPTGGPLTPIPYPLTSHLPRRRCFSIIAGQGLLFNSRNFRAKEEALCFTFEKDVW